MLQLSSNVIVKTYPLRLPPPELRAAAAAHVGLDERDPQEVLPALLAVEEALDRGAENPEILPRRGVGGPRGHRVEHHPETAGVPALPGVRPAAGAPAPLAHLLPGRAAELPRALELGGVHPQEARDVLPVFGLLGEGGVEAEVAPAGRREGAIAIS